MKPLLFLLPLFASAVTASAQSPVRFDFEDCEIGQEWPMWNYYGIAPNSTAVVAADPKNPSNKVLHVVVREWNSYPRFTLPEWLAGPELCAQKDYVDLRLYRASNDPNDNKKFTICQGNQRIYEDDGYPHQGSLAVWQNRTYTLPESSTAQGTLLALGLHSDASDYYIDDIVIRSEFDNCLTAEGQTIDISGQNSSSSYVTYDTPLLVPAGQQITFLTSRYTYFNSKVQGEGTIHIYSGGERTYLGGSDKKYPDWTGFSGQVHVYPYTQKSSSNGFYGLVWMHNGKTFNADQALNELGNGKANNCVARASLILHEGATLAAESGTRGMRIGRLEMQPGSKLYGYMKSKDANNTYYIIGGTGEDSNIAGTIQPWDGNQKMLVGLIKEGLGTLRITSSGNQITGGIRVLRGRTLINGTSAIQGLYVMKEAAAGGTGTVQGETHLYGVLEPGDASLSALRLNGRLVLRPTGRIDCEILDAQHYDQLQVTGNVTYYNIGQDFSASTKQPRLRIRLAEGAQLQVGDAFTLLEAKGKENYNDVEWAFDVRYPEAYTWSVEQQATAEGFRVVARVTSLTYSGQGDLGYDDAEDEPTTSTDDGQFDLSLEQKDPTPLRTFADARDLLVGTCVPVWTIDVDNDQEPRARLIAEQYNMVVCENEMKFDATEPTQGTFSYYHGDRLVRFAERHNMYIRGHALAWHQQVPSWLTADGNKNTRGLSRQQLLDILKNHIVNVVGHWKGKICEWDVANEVLDDNQTTIYSNPNGYDLRPSVWATGIGEDFLDSAFVWAHQTDPDAILILNDYGVEGKGWGKSEALYNLAKRLRDSGIPIHGVGLQSHMDANLQYISSIDDNIARYEQEGFLCHITELDLGIDANTQPVLEQQGQSYYQLARIAMQHANCRSLMIWGLSDDLTWRGGKRPLLYDANLQPKPAYWGVHAALRQAAGKEIAGIEAVEADPIETTTLVPAVTLDLLGRPVQDLVPGQLYIRQGRKLIIRQ